MKNFMDMLGFTHKPLLNFSLEANERVSTWQAKAAPTVTEQLGLSGDGSLVVYCLLACLFKGWGGVHLWAEGVIGEVRGGQNMRIDGRTFNDLLLDYTTTYSNNGNDL